MTQTNDKTESSLDQTDIPENTLQGEKPEQQLLPLAFIDGTPLTELPEDLYIPPDALKVFLETFEGPLDLLLYLIRKQNLNILDIPITEITTQYLQYINLMQELQLELAAEYLLMAALLLEIKSRLLLPQPEAEEIDEADPRAYLVQQLQEYALIKKAAEDLDALPRMGRDTFLAEADMPDIERARIPPLVSQEELIEALCGVLVRMELFTSHHIARESLSVRERMSSVLENLSRADRLLMQSLFTRKEGRAGAVVSLLAILELCKETLLYVEQNEAFGPIEIWKQE